MTQKQQVLRALKNRRKGLTPLDAITLLGCTKLSTRIGELIADGVQISKEWATVTTRNKTTRVMNYKLVAGK